MEESMSQRRTAIIALTSLTVILICSEVGLRLAGTGSYPLYDVDDEIKYIPSADQHGNYLNRYAWHFNNRHMASSFEWSAEQHPNLLLLGNSIVLGGATSGDEEKLGARLEEALKGQYRVWPVAAGGWSNINEMAYLDRNADVWRNADAVVIEFMQGGLSVPTLWAGYDVAPDRKPWLLTAYVLRQYWRSLLAKRRPPEYGALPFTRPTDKNQLARFKALVTSIGKDRKLVIFLYPTGANLRNKLAWQNMIAPIVELCRVTAARCLDIAQAPEWKESAYFSDGVHQTAEGTKILASLLARAVD
jgi:hypothetical protein